MRKQLSLDPLSRRCVTEREGPELDYTVLGISSGKRASNNRQIVKIIYQFNLWKMDQKNQKLLEIRNGSVRKQKEMKDNYREEVSIMEKLL